MPADDRVTYICARRDPRDAAMSWDSHNANIDSATFIALREKAAEVMSPDELLAGAALRPRGTARERFWSWVDPVAPGQVVVSDLEIMLHHLDTFWRVRDQPNIVLVRYEDLLDDLDGQMRYIAGRLGIPITETAWPDLVQAATFEGMKGRAGEFAPEASHDGFYYDRAQFHRGSTGQWPTLSLRRLGQVADLGPSRLMVMSRPAT